MRSNNFDYVSLTRSNKIEISFVQNYTVVALASLVITQIYFFQLTYREITVDAGLMEPIGEGRPLLTVQDLESRLVFTKCKVGWVCYGSLYRVSQWELHR